MPSGTAYRNPRSHLQSSRSSSWKWIAPYSWGASLKSISRPVQLYPVTARFGLLTVQPCRRWGEVSVIFVEEISSEKSQDAIRSFVSAPGGNPPLREEISASDRARRKSRGRSILPLQYPVTTS